MKKDDEKKSDEICLSNVKARRGMFGGGQAKERDGWLDGWTLSLQMVGRNQLRTVLGSFVEAGRAGETKRYKGTREPRR